MISVKALPMVTPVIGSSEPRVVDVIEGPLVGGEVGADDADLD